MVIYLYEGNHLICTCSISHGVWFLLGFPHCNILVSLWNISVNVEICRQFTSNSLLKHLLDTPCSGGICYNLRFINVSGARTPFAMAFGGPGITSQMTNYCSIYAIRKYCWDHGYPGRLTESGGVNIWVTLLISKKKKWSHHNHSSLTHRFSHAYPQNSFSLGKDHGLDLTLELRIFFHSSR